MDWLEAMNESIDYMEGHLLDPITPEDVAAHVNISGFYFQNGFKIITGMTIGSYLRNRRLYLAALDVISGNEKIIDLAFKYGYETPESFTKAFSRFHGCPPAQLKKSPSKIQIFQPLLIKISVEGGNNMNYKIEKSEAFKIIGMERIFSYENSYTEIPLFWTEYYTKYSETYNKKLGGSCGIWKYGVCIEDPAMKSQFAYMIAGDYHNEEIPEGLKVVEIPAQTWAKFECKGPLPVSLQSVNTRIFHEWLPGNPKYEIAAGYNIELYTMGDTSSQDYISEIWIPVKEK